MIAVARVTVSSKPNISLHGARSSDSSTRIGYRRTAVMIILTIRNCRGNCDVSDDTSPLQFLILLPYKQLSITNEQTIANMSIPYLRVWSTRGKIDRSILYGRLFVLYLLIATKA